MNKKNTKKRLRKGRALFLILGSVLLMASFWLGWNLFRPIRLKSQTPVVELGESFSSLDNIRSVFMASAEDVVITGDVDTQKTGEYDVTYSYGSYTVQALVRVADTTPPELEVQDVNADVYEEVDAESFVVQCTDASKVSLTISNPEALANKSGTQTVRIQAMDEYGNKTIKSAQLIRTEDTQAPVAEQAPQTVYYTAGDEFNAAELKVTDDRDSNPQVSVDTSSLDMSTAGEYTVVYTVTDRSGNETVYQQKVVVEAPAAAQSESEGKVVYLTFDDGPSENTESILNILERYGIQATFFVTGNNQAYNSSIVKAYQLGNTIGLHTYTHSYSSVYASDEAYFTDLQTISDMVESLIGVRSTIIRFPGGSSNTVSANYSSGIMSRLTSEVTARGYQYFDWNVSSGDASGNTVDTATIIANSTSASADKLVILFHDSSPKTTTVEALPSIIEYYLNQGYTFAPLSMSSYAAHHGVNN